MESDYLKESNGRSGGGSLPSTLFTGSGSPINGLQLSFPEASTYTVQFSVTPPTLVGSHGSATCEAIISWVLEGNRIIRRVSVGNGVSVSGTAQGVQVQLIDVTPDNGQVMNAPYTVTVSATSGVRSAIELPILFRDGVSVPAHSTVIMPVPQDCGIMAVKLLLGVIPASVIPPTPGAIRVTQQSSVAAFSVYTVESGNEEYVNVAPGVTQLLVRNFDPVNDVFVTPIWGIDG